MYFISLFLVDTNKDCYRFVVDNWLEIEIQHQILGNLLVSDSFQYMIILLNLLSLFHSYYYIRATISCDRIWIAFVAPQDTQAETEQAKEETVQTTNQGDREQ